jgi:hypothetical protein
MENAPEETDEQVISRVERALVSATWVSADGRRKKISEMDDGHLANSILMIRRGTDAVGRPVGQRAARKLPALEAEWRFRYGDKEVVSERPFNGRPGRRKNLKKGSNAGRTP